MMNLKDTIVLITGASSGIGEATARAFARQGSRLILAARRLERLQTLAEELKQAHGTESITLRLDVTKHLAVPAELERLPETWRAIDVLVNNAGLSRGLDKLHEGLTSDWDEMIDANIKGLLAVSRAVIPWMVRRNRGHVINIGSIAGFETYPGGNVYCATKAAVHAISRGMAMDLLGTDIRVTEVAPGLAETEFSVVRFHGDRDRAKVPYKGVKPLSGDDIAEAIVWCTVQPEHVNIAELVIVPTAQRSAMLVHRET
jgi:3-hydroxy acid dehydrogenase/malonic semialdehyde reductase